MMYFTWFLSAAALAAAILNHLRAGALLERIESIERSERLRRHKETTGAWPVRKRDT